MFTWPIRICSFTCSASAKPKIRLEANAPRGPVPEDHRRQRDEAAPVGHRLVEASHGTQREIGPAQARHQPPRITFR